MLTTSKSNSVNQTLISEALNILKLIMNNIKQSSIQKKITEARRKYQNDESDHELNEEKVKRIENNKNINKNNENVQNHIF